MPVTRKPGRVSLDLTTTGGNTLSLLQDDERDSLLVHMRSKDGFASFGLCLYKDQLNEMHHFIGAFLEDTERAKESK